MAHLRVWNAHCCSSATVSQMMNPSIRTAAIQSVRPNGASDLIATSAGSVVMSTSAFSATDAATYEEDVSGETA